MLGLLLATAVAGAPDPAPLPTDGASEPAPLPVPSAETWEAVRERAFEHVRQRKRADTVGMSVLLGWSVANLGVGAAGWALAKEPEWIRFHQMNLAWNGINLAIAVPGLVGALREDPGRHTFGSVLRADANSRFVYGLNAGLDVGYVAAGAWLWERGERLDDPLLVGFGRAVVLQGTFLLLLDATMLAWHDLHARRFLLVPEVGEVLGVRLVVEL